MVVNIGSKIIAPGETYVFDRVEGTLKRIYFYVVAGNSPDPSISNLQLSFSDTFSNFYTFTANDPTFKMQSDKGTYEGKIFLRNIANVIPRPITYVEILQP